MATLYPQLYDQIRKSLEKRFAFRLWDVGHGLSMWIKTPTCQNHWIDLGKTDEFSPSQHVNLIYKVKHIDFLIISHPHEDHLADLPNFLHCFGDPETLRRNCKNVPDGEKYGDMSQDWQKDFKSLDTRFSIGVNWVNNPQNPQNNGGIEYVIRGNDYSQEINGNNISLVTMLLYKGLLMVCPGDIEPQGWDILWAKFSQDFNKLINRASKKVLIAPHHGSKNGYSKNMMNVVEPHIVIISDISGRTETHQDYYIKPIGIIQNNQLKKFFSTKRKGRLEIKENFIGELEFNQYE